MEELTQNNRIEGTVTAILFRNEENGYTVLRLDGRGAGRNYRRGQYAWRIPGGDSGAGGKLGPAPYLWGAV